MKVITSIPMYWPQQIRLNRIFTELLNYLTVCEQFKHLKIHFNSKKNSIKKTQQEQYNLSTLQAEK